MVSHQTTLVHIAVDTDNTSLARILPGNDIPLVRQYRLFVRIHRYHQLVVV